MILHFCPRDDWDAASPTGTYGADIAGDAGLHPLLHAGAGAHPGDAAGSAAAPTWCCWRSTRPAAACPVIWEDGDPPHPDGLQFPHLYAPIPVAAVMAVHE